MKTRRYLLAGVLTVAVLTTPYGTPETAFERCVRASDGADGDIAVCADNADLPCEPMPYLEGKRKLCQDITDRMAVIRATQTGGRFDR